MCSYLYRREIIFSSNLDKSSNYAFSIKVFIIVYPHGQTQGEAGSPGQPLLINFIGNSGTDPLKKELDPN